MLFFYFKKEGKVKKFEKEVFNSSREMEFFLKVVLKEWNGVVFESDFLVKRLGRKVVWVLGSEGEEEDEVFSFVKGQKFVLDCLQVFLFCFVIFFENNVFFFDIFFMDSFLLGILKCCIVWKQFLKWIIQEVLEEQSEDEDREVKRKKEEEEEEILKESFIEVEVVIEKEGEDGDQFIMFFKFLKIFKVEILMESVLEFEVVMKQELQEEEEQIKFFCRVFKMFSSFFIFWKLVVKKEVKEEELGVLGKEGVVEGFLDLFGYNFVKNNYYFVEDVCWKLGQKVFYLVVVWMFEKIEEVFVWFWMVEMLSNLLCFVVVLLFLDFFFVFYFSFNYFGLFQQGLEFGVGDGVFFKVVVQVIGWQLEFVWVEVVEKGDVGLVVENSCSIQRFMLLLFLFIVFGVFSKFCDIVRFIGSVFIVKKIDIIKGFFVVCCYLEVWFIVRFLSGWLCFGLVEQLVLVVFFQVVSFMFLG